MTMLIYWDIFKAISQEYGNQLEKNVDNQLVDLPSPLASISKNLQKNTGMLVKFSFLFFAAFFKDNNYLIHQNMLPFR